MKKLFIISIVIAALFGIKIGYQLATPPVVYDNIVVVVHSGDTLWSLAGEFATSKEDIREVIHRICEANNLNGKHVYPGQTITIPVVKE